MRASAFLYPWDVVGDPYAPVRVARLGVGQVTLASAYHSTRALTPRHPRHRIVTARHSAVLYPPDPARWSGRLLRPYEQRWTEGRDPFGEAAEALAGAGLEVHSWVVLAHNSRLGEEHPEIAVRNAYGDRYPWAPCIARPEVREYAVELAAEAAVRPGARGTELESCGWYGLAHLHAHDKTAGVALGGAGHYLMSLCFCEVCEEGYAGAGADPERLRAAVATALEPLWRGKPGPEAGPAGDREAEWTAVERLLGEEPADATRRWRRSVAGGLRRAAVAAVRRAARPGFQVLLHADPAWHRCGANAGADPEDLLEYADGAVLPCAGGEGGRAARAAVLDPFARVRPEGAVLAANFTVVSGMGGSPATLAADAAHAAGLGADELRLYHAGLASDADLAQVGAFLG
ncbi:hypothetical protein [Streptomyces xinghaiensis]|uniref:hypothetical protein n=1 Tax=Streptomyces xinghaiensis TaxID=1038928 RepID=UPI000BAEA9C7|nr:hypothetical protein [Streptomyces xinghaiensis]